MKLYTKKQMEFMFIAGGKMARNFEAPGFEEVLKNLHSTDVRDKVTDIFLSEGTYDDLVHQDGGNVIPWDKFENDTYEDIVRYIDDAVKNFGR
jgi:hypothetical protein